MTELEKAIDLIEEAGGVVMMAIDLEEEETREEYLARLEAADAEEKQELEDFQERRREMIHEMKKDFDRMLGSKNFSVTAVEDMVHGYGCDMDDLEDLIHNFY